MNELSIFENAELGNVRVVQKDGEPWFVAKDVADALGYAWSGSKNTQHIPDEWKGVETVSTPSGTQEMIVLSEQGLYFFLGRSDKHNALPYQKWIAGDVVPSIRKTGCYGNSNTQALPQDYISALRALADAEEAKMLAQATTKAALAERDHAIKTKAEIGARREATAMATASIAVRELDKVKQQICDSTQYKQVKAIQWLPVIFHVRSSVLYSQIGKRLTAIGKEEGLPPIEIENSEYGTVKAHHIDVIRILYGRLLADKNMMAQYR